MSSEFTVVGEIGVRAGNGVALPILFSRDRPTEKRVLEFFTANIRNLHTRRAYMKAASELATWCEARSLGQLQDLQPVHIATYIEEMQWQRSIPSVKVHLAAIRALFDWLVVGQVMSSNPASVVRGPKYSIKKGKTSVLTADEASTLLESIDTKSIIGLRDRALIALMTYTFARVGAAAEKTRIEDVYTQGRRMWVRLHEKGGKLHEMPCHHKLEAFLEQYIRRASLANDPKGFLFRTTAGRSGGLTPRAMSQSDVFRMIRRRANDAGIKTKICCHTFRATGITEYLRNGGKLEVAQQMANHESARTTGLYDRRNDQVSLDEVERILI